MRSNSPQHIVTFVDRSTTVIEHFFNSCIIIMDCETSELFAVNSTLKQTTTYLRVLVLGWVAELTDSDILKEYNAYISVRSVSLGHLNTWRRWHYIPSKHRDGSVNPTTQCNIPEDQNRECEYCDSWSFQMICGHILIGNWSCRMVCGSCGHKLIVNWSLHMVCAHCGHKLIVS